MGETKSKLLLHIGPHKTGTTAIQIALQGATQELLQKSIFFDSLEAYAGRNSHQLADILSTDRKNEAINTLEKIEGSGEFRVISSENFSRLKLEDVKFLKENLQFDDVRIIYFLRNPLLRIKSDWQELVKHGYRFTFLEFIAGRLARPINDRMLNDEVRISPWREIFGADNVDIHLYDQIDDVVSYFFDYYFGIKKKNTKNRANVSLDLETVETLRALMGLQKVFLEKSNILVNDLNPLIDNLRSVVKKNDPKYNKSFSLSMDSFSLRAIERILVERNSTLIKNQINSEYIFDKRSETYNFISSDVWLEHPKLMNSVFSLREKIIEEFGIPQIDQRLSQV